MKNLFILMSLLAFFACEEEVSDVSLDPGYDYFPLVLNTFRTYEVEEVNIDAFVPDTLSYYLKEVVHDSLVSGTGVITYLLNRYKSPDSVNWTLDSVWSARRSETVAIINENDVALCKMTFPVKAGKTWDGNAFNVFDAQEYQFAIHSGYVHENLSLSSDVVIRVVIEDIPENLVNQDQRSESYARGIGLVEKNYIQLSFCTLNCEEKGTTVGAIEQGRVLSQKLIKYGEE
ncbi:MAG: hypothetical protein RIC35_14680 [Marinoscillum sp.]